MRGATTSEVAIATGYTQATSVTMRPHSGRFGSARSESSNQLSTPTVRLMRSCSTKSGALGHQHGTLRRTLPLAQVQAVDEAER